MVRSRSSSRTLAGMAALAMALTSLPTMVEAAPVIQPATRSAPAALLPAWDGSIDLYRDGVFTTQKSWLWCTAAGVQIVRNIVEPDDDHSTTGQRRYFDWMRKRNRYDLPVSAGVDPQGWTAGLRSAAANLRRTGLPVALTVANGGHGWILTGFEATADPLLTDEFEVTSVRVVGPLFGRQSKNGYDMPPDTRLTAERLRRFFTPWRYAPLAMVWDGKYVSMQPVAKGHKPPVAWAARAARFALEIHEIRLGAAR